MNELAAASIVILLGLAGAHAYVYTLHRRKLFAYLGLAWLTNLLYIIVEAVTADVAPADFSKLVAVSAATMLSTFFFYLAAADLLNITARARTLMGLGLAFLPILWGAGVALTFDETFLRAELLTGGVALATLVTVGVLGWAFLRLPTAALLLVVRNEKPTDEASTPLTVSRREGPSKNITEAAHRSSRDLTVEVRRTLRAGRLTLGVSLLVYAALQPFYPLQWRLLSGEPGFLGSLFWVSLVAKCLHGSALPFVVLADFRDTAEALRARSVAEELGVLTASIEHDIKSPLALIHKEVANIKAQYQHITPLVERLNRVLAHATRISAAASVIPATREMVEHFHEFAEVLNIVAIVRGAVAAVKKVDKRGDIRVDLEPTRSEILVYGDRARLTQAFVNLLNNAVEACRDAGRIAPYVEIYCIAPPAQRTCSVVIVDHGTGIAEANLAKIGKPLFSTKTNRGHNRGIGVFMAGRVVRLHGGTLRFQSDGHTFTAVIMTFPVTGRTKKEPIIERSDERDTADAIPGVVPGG